MKKLRQSFLCMACDWHYQMSINIESLVVTYKDSFCSYLSSNFIETLYIKYNSLIKKLLYFEEFVFLTTSR